MKQILIFTITIVGLLVACKPDDTNQSTARAEITEIYDVVVDGEAYEQGALTYKEHKEFKGDKEFGTIYYNPDGTERGKAYIIYEEGKERAVGFRYFNPLDSLLAYYQYSYNDKGEQVAQHAYDASTDELLRIERYKFNEDGNMTVKEIRNADDEVIQRFNFKYDGYGNEVAMYVDRGNDVVDVYTYKIMAYNDDKEWTEKWGFVNDKPRTYHKITRQ